jgi:hypothetical protein
MQLDHFQELVSVLSVNPAGRRKASLGVLIHLFGLKLGIIRTRVHSRKEPYCPYRHGCVGDSRRLAKR